MINIKEGKLKKRVGISLIILVLALIIFSIYFLVFYSKPIANSQEFAQAMQTCNRVSWTRQDEPASWLYTIAGNAPGDACNVKVVLRQIKQGSIENEKLQGKEMLCTVLKTDTQFPEKDISKCTGKLKEDLQDILIQRMHNYLLENVGEVQDAFAGIWLIILNIVLTNYNHEKEH